MENKNLSSIPRRFPLFVSLNVAAALLEVAAALTISET